MDLADEIIEAVTLGNIADVEAFFNNGCHVDIQDSEGTSALQIATANGFEDIVKALLSRKASVDLANVYGWTPLMLAAKYGHVSIASLLLKHLAKVNVSNKIGLTPIMAAVWSGEISIVKMLLESGAIIDYDPVTGMGPPQCDTTPLMMAALLGHDSIVQLLLKNGADIDRASHITGWTPLMLASWGGHKKVVKMLIERGADGYKVDICGRSALDVAIMNYQQEVKECLENTQIFKSVYAVGKNSKILKAVENGNVDLVKAIIAEDHMSVNATNLQDGVSVLMLACMEGHTDIVQALVANGANINAQDFTSGWTPLMYAAFHRHSNIVKHLVDEGANIRIRANDGYTVLDLVNHLDNVDPGIIQTLTAKLANILDLSGPDLISSTAVLPLLSMKESYSLFPKMPPKQSPSLSRSKWLGGVSNKVQTIFSRSSVRLSDSNSIPTIKIASSPSKDDVFDDENDTKAGIPELPKAKLSMSALKSPNRYLANNLKKWSLLEPITPPFIDDPVIADDAETSLLQQETLENRKQKRVILSTPMLLKSYMKKPITKPNHTLLFKNPPPVKSAGEKHGIRRSEHDCKRLSSSKLTSEPKPARLQLQSSKVNSASSACTVESSNTGGLSSLLEKNALQKHIEKFKEQEIDMDAFKCLTKEDFSEIGIDSTFSQDALMKILENLKKDI